jgi:Flp pilus assembly protein TadD
MKSDFAEAYARRGGVYASTGQHDRAIQDLNEAIRLKPDSVKAYSILGAVYVLTGKKEEGCRSFVRACELGDCEGYEISKQKGYCK